MAVKTITIDMEAYGILSKEKRENESFSKVIKRTVGGGRKTAGHLLEQLDTISFEGDTLDKMDEVLRKRDESPLSSQAFDSYAAEEP